MSETLDILYRIDTASGSRAEFPIRLDPATLMLADRASDDSPAWTRLECDQCGHCPLNAAETPHCPAATALVSLLAFCRDLPSFETVALEVVTPERIVSKDTTAQRAVSALMGLLLAASGCPHLAFLRPMARFHLPLASAEETSYRAASMYLLAQYFRRRRGLPVDDDSLAGLSHRYDQAHRVNVAFAKRLRSAIEKDSSLNAVVLLDLFAQAMPVSIDDQLAELEPLFATYLED